MAAATLMVFAVNAQETKSVADTTALSAKPVSEQMVAIATDATKESRAVQPAVVDSTKVATNQHPAILDSQASAKRQRVDRNVRKTVSVNRGEFIIGLSASYGTLDATDADFMLLLDDINIGLKRFTVSPSLAYAYRNNCAIGLRVGYEQTHGNLGNVALDLGAAADLSFALSNLDVKNESLNCALFHRNYLAFDRRGIFGAILETELRVKSGSTTMTTGIGEEAHSSVSNNLSAKLSLNPGLSVYIFPQVCLSVTVGIGGLYYNNVRQYDAANVETGSRDRMGLNFKLNLEDIRLGVNIHLWNNKKR